MTSLMTLLRFLTLFSVMLQGLWTRTYGMPDTWIVNEKSEKDGSSRGDRLTHKETTQCTCTCEVQDNQVKELVNRKPPESSHWNEVNGGGYSNDQTDGWSSDGQLSTGDDGHEQPSELKDAGSELSKQTSLTDDSNHNSIYTPTDELNEEESPDRYKGYSWGHGSRFPWKSLKDVMCIRQPCDRDADCCLRWNICDRSAKVCTNCWYGHPCMSERDCCHDFPYCQRKWKKDEHGRPMTIESGRCADQR